MTDNALAYRRGQAWHQALHDLGAQARFTRRYRPQTNGKACEDCCWRGIGPGLTPVKV